MQLKGLNILITSNEPWGDVWFSKHNYANELSKHNNVVFVDPVKSWRPSNLAGARPRLRKIHDGLHVMSYSNVVPSANIQSLKLNNTLVSRAIRRALALHGFKTDLFLPFDPSRLFRPDLLGAKRSVFIAVDQYILSIPGERFMYTNVDGFITLSEKFNPLYAPYTKPLLTVSQAISEDEFKATPVQSKYTGHGLYVGTLDFRLDLGIVERMAQAHPDVPFVFIGPYKLAGMAKAEAIFREGRYHNIHLAGVVPYKELASHIALARFGFAPMDKNYPGNAFLHHKIFQYWAVGKPVFCNRFTEYEPVAHLLYMSDDEATTLSNLDRFLLSGEPDHLRGERIAYAQSRTYETILGQVGDFLDRLPVS